jgi:NCAIR mutase (PurE)-related protein
LDPTRIKDLLERVKSGSSSIDDAVSELRELPFSELGYATVDHHRALRQGAPEVILGEGKTVEQIEGISAELARTGQNVFITRLDATKAEKLKGRFPSIRYNELGRTASIETTPIEIDTSRTVALVSAGTSDLPVAEECGETLRVLGAQCHRVYDVGVAGIHRLMSKRETLVSASVVVVVAGMEGALASVVGGLVSVPVIAVPTSVGYGAAFHGLAALLGMLTSCASGVTVVNIDNGFGAAFAAHRLLQAIKKGDAG